MFRILYNILRFALLLILQLLVVTFVEYVIFLISPGVKEKLINSLAYKATSTNSIIGYLQIFKNWFFKILFSGDFGILISSGERITHSLYERCSITFTLVVGSLVISLVLALLIVYLKHNFSYLSFVTALISGITILSSTHYIVLGYIAVVELKSFNNYWSIFPFLVLSIGSGTLNEIIDILDTELGQIWNSKYIQAARARGGSILRNASIPMTIALVRVINAKLPLLLGGSFIVEVVMNLPGLGVWVLTTGIAGRDYNLLLAITFVVSLVIIFSNTLANALHSLLDPRPVKLR